MSPPPARAGPPAQAPASSRVEASRGQVVELISEGGGALAELRLGLCEEELPLLLAPLRLLDRRLPPFPLFCCVPFDNTPP